MFPSDAAILTPKRLHRTFLSTKLPAAKLETSMRLVTFREGSSPAQFGIREDDRVTSIASATENAVLADLAGAARKPTGPSLPLSEITLLQPVMRPGKVICIGLNYVD